MLVGADIAQGGDLAVVADEADGITRRAHPLQNGSFGQIGDGVATTTPRLTPVDVNGLTSGVRAIATGGVRVLNDQLVGGLRIPDYIVDEVAASEQQELARRERLYRGDRPAPDVRGRTVILVDDGLATGATMLAAVKALRQQQPARIVVAVPTASPETCEQLRAEVDDIICAITPEPFHAVGLWYEDFSQTTDEEVRDLLARSTEASRGAESVKASATAPEGERCHAKHD